MRNLILVAWMTTEHRLPTIITKSRPYTRLKESRLYPRVFEHYCVFCRRYTDDWWDPTTGGLGLD